jgi:hypothetical protein
MTSGQAVTRTLCLHYMLNMPSFDYRTPSAALDPWVARFPDWAAGRDEWERTPGDVLDVELPAPPKLARPRIFISHSQYDPTDFAERAVYLANQEGFDYWLDILDPTLANVAAGVPRARAIASIIEIALLNCTHLLALYSANAERSRWVPYEYGRAKYRRRLYNQHVASWTPTLAPHVASVRPEYLDLGHVFRVEQPLRSWLDGERYKFDPALTKPTSYWSKVIPPKLPP